MAAADDVAVWAAAADKDQRGVGGAVEFYLGCGARLRKKIANGTVDLRRAAQAVSILHARVLFGGAVRFADFAAFVEQRQVAGGATGAGVRAGMHDAGIEGAGAAAEGV